jgi:enediyne biosynthesis protein E3
MAVTVLDALPLSGRPRLPAFLAGPGKNHIYMAYVGIGWAMARLPRFCWSRIDAPDPLLRWLVLDGYGFHQAYFHTARYVGEQFQDPAFPWPRDDHSRYAGRAIDQGIGRALWFVGGTDPDLVATMIEKFAEPRRADLYSGAGLAATYAGGADERELRAFWDRAGEYRSQVALGCAFAAEARLLPGLGVPHVDLATRVFCNLTPAQAARICADKLPEDGPQPSGTAGQTTTPAYELWRQRVAEELAFLARC